VQHWTPVRPREASQCNVATNSTQPTSAAFDGRTLGLQDGHTYFFTLQAVSGAGVAAVSPSAAFVYVASAPGRGLVADVVQAVTGRELHLADDIDYLPATACCLVAQWTPFAHMLGAGTVAYAVALVVDGQVRAVVVVVCVCGGGGPGGRTWGCHAGCR
jgi:hypothetical protein